MYVWIYSCIYSDCSCMQYSMSKCVCVGGWVMCVAALFSWPMLSLLPSLIVAHSDWFFHLRSQVQFSLPPHLLSHFLSFSPLCPPFLCPFISTHFFFPLTNFINPSIMSVFRNSVSLPLLSLLFSHVSMSGWSFWAHHLFTHLLHLRGGFCNISGVAVQISCNVVMSSAPTHTGARGIINELPKNNIERGPNLLILFLLKMYHF